MNKKSYKQMQNRLYREIKRRIIAEDRTELILRTPIRHIVDRMEIEKLQSVISISKRMLHDANSNFIEHAKQEAAESIIQTMRNHGFIGFSIEELEDDVSPYYQLKAVCYVARPPQE